MNKQEILKQYIKQEDKIRVAQILDKVQFVNSKHQIQYTDFLDGYEQKIVKKTFEQIGYKKGILYGGYSEAERKQAILIPEKLQDLIKDNLQESSIIQDIMSVIEIQLPHDLYGEYNHRDYLSGLLKLGIKREKMGDIIVREDGADILVQKDIVPYILNNLPDLTRFKKSNIHEKAISQLKIVPIKKETIMVVVAQPRLDSIISELIHVSRTKANEIILQERAIVNYEIKTKNAIMLKTGDILTIRGKGKYQIGQIESKTSKGKIRLEVEKYI